MTVALLELPDQILAAWSVQGDADFVQRRASVLIFETTRVIKIFIPSDDTRATPESRQSIALSWMSRQPAIDVKRLPGTLPAVSMHRLADRNRLDRVIFSTSASPNAISKLMYGLLSLHESLPLCRATPDTLWRETQHNLMLALARLRGSLTSDFFNSVRPLVAKPQFIPTFLREAVLAQRFRVGHGDLRMTNLFHESGQLLAIDPASKLAARRLPIVAQACALSVDARLSGLDKHATAVRMSACTDELDEALFDWYALPKALVLLRFRLAEATTDSGSSQWHQPLRYLAERAAVAVRG